MEATSSILALSIQLAAPIPPGDLPPPPPCLRTPACMRTLTRSTATTLNSFSSHQCRWWWHPSASYCTSNFKPANSTVWHCGTALPITAQANVQASQLCCTMAPLCQLLRKQLYKPATCTSQLWHPSASYCTSYCTSITT